MTSRTLADFDISVTRGDTGYNAILRAPDGRRIQVTFAQPFEEFQLKYYIAEVTRGPQNARRSTKGGAEAVARELGQTLFAAMFAGAAQQRLDAALDALGGTQPGGLRLRLDLSGAPELAELPWEYLYHPERNFFLALSPDLTLVRYVQMPEPVRQLHVEPPLRILAMACSPTDLEPLDIARERNNLAVSLQRLTGVPFMSPQDGQTYNFIDVENDGDLDVCLTNYALAPTRFYRNNGGNYQSVTTPFTTTVGHLANCWGDVNNDGYLDVLTTEDGVAAVKYYKNNGDGTFTAAATAGTAGSNVCGIAFADYDNDGDLDFYTNGPGEGRALFRNTTLAGNRKWAQFTLQGSTSNRSAIGATLRLKADLGGNTVWQIRQVTAHNSFQSQNDLRQHFGLNEAGTIDSLEVRWPSGLNEVFTNLAVNNFYKIVEGQGINILTPVTEPKGVTALEVKPNPVSREFRVKAGEKISAVEMYDSSGRVLPLQSTEISSGEWNIWLLGNPPAGAYYLRVLFENGSTASHQVMKF